MGVLHFLNVKHGDCSVIRHPSGHVTVIDVYNASKAAAPTLVEKALDQLSIRGNFNQKENPVNPISYMRGFGISGVFRFIATHPDMDHLGGIRDFFEAFEPANFWDTDNKCQKDFSGGGPYDEDDWDFYRRLRDRNSESDPKRLVLYAGARGKYWNQAEDGSGGGDGLHVLAPTRDLVAKANETEDFNDASYVILYRSNGGRVLFAGDSHDRTWEYILQHHEDDVRDIDLLIAPHHGRKSARSYDFLDVLNPALTFFGNANSEHLAYGAWNYRKLPFITNNQANCMVVNTNVRPMQLYVTNPTFAEKINPRTQYAADLQAWYCCPFG
jgi:beta-lactamase superfamily II metal-dependent hydrolase